MILTITPNPLLNLLGDDHITTGQVNRVSPLQAQAEGKGINVARVLHRWGHQVCIAGFAGGMSGQWFRSCLQDHFGTVGPGEQCQLCLIDTEADLRTGMMMGNDHHPTTILPSGFPVSEREQQALVAQVAHLLRMQSYHLVTINGSVPDPSCHQLLSELVTVCHAAKVPVWVDSYGPAMDHLLQGEQLPDLVKPNRQEFDSSEHWQRVANCHLSDGAAGVIVDCPAGQFQVSCRPITEVNPIGCGDCYLAGLAHGYLVGLSPEESLRWAAAAGAVNASKASIAEIARDEVAVAHEWITISEITQAN